MYNFYLNFFQKKDKITDTDFGNNAMNKMIIYEDDTLIVVHKPAGIATQTSRIGQADLVSELKNYRKSRNEDTYIGVIHRLDQPVEGLLVFAKTQKAAKRLSEGISSGSLGKKYSALIAGTPPNQEGECIDYLLKDAHTNLSAIVPKTTKGAKEARLHWKLVKSLVAETSAYSLVEVELFTGRHHQIRVQLSGAGMPLLGDMKYGSDLSKEISRQLKIDSTALAADSLEFIHPKSGKKMNYKIDYPKSWGL